MLRHLILVETAGVEPASCDCFPMASTCFSHLYRFFVSRLSQWAGGFATILSQSRWFNNSPIKSARTLTTSQLPLESVREETSLQLRQRVRTLRSLVFFWQKFNEANCHPRHAAVGPPVQSKPWRPQLFIHVLTCNISSFCKNSIFFFTFFMSFYIFSSWNDLTILWAAEYI